ncbi:MAG: 30S ribosomal protein S9 [Deltaproteobacteria bacterium RIFCSPHIGHO2_02_FULL_40_11]|nr:MAG: 30S ribosomal protein S9 [Deltaproteobacteria bacterium RIFCSPHIGHO2_02_FULL_40_11]
MATIQKKEDRFYATGRRKSSIARVYLYPQGQGNIQINQSELKTYFPVPSKQITIQQPLKLTKVDGQVDLYVNVCGGGKSGQADAIRHGISRALVNWNPELRKTLKSHGYLTRDSRKVERKKAGQRGARANYQFSKR